jgi:hypothetical protein
VVEDIFEEVAKPLSLLFNKSFQCKIFPNNWKIAFIIPLFKRSDKSTALLGSKIFRTSITSCSLTTIVVKVLQPLSSKSGRSIPSGNTYTK